MKNGEKAIEILQRSQDGDQLSPEDLYLLQAVVNGWQTEEGQKRFDEIYQMVMAGTYQPEWFQGIEHLLRDHQGYIRYKGQIVEHYSSSWAYSEEGRKAALEVAQRCKHLEALGEPLNTCNVIWQWEKFRDRKAA